MKFSLGMRSKASRRMGVQRALAASPTKAHSFRAVRTEMGGGPLELVGGLPMQAHRCPGCEPTERVGVDLKLPRYGIAPLDASGAKAACLQIANRAIPCRLPRRSNCDRNGRGIGRAHPRPEDHQDHLKAARMQGLRKSLHDENELIDVRTYRILEGKKWQRARCLQNLPPQPQRGIALTNEQRGSVAVLRRVVVLDDLQEPVREQRPHDPRRPLWIVDPRVPEQVVGVERRSVQRLEGGPVRGPSWR